MSILSGSLNQRFHLFHAQNNRLEKRVNVFNKKCVSFIVDRKSNLAKESTYNLPRIKICCYRVIFVAFNYFVQEKRVVIIDSF